MPLSPKEKAELALSVKTHSKTRPLSPAEVALRLEELQAELGSEERVARALGFTGTDMITRFKSVLALPPTVRDLVGWEGPKEGKIGLDMAYRISTLQSEAEKDLLAKAVVQHLEDKHITKDEVAAIVSLRGKNPNWPLQDCIEKIIKIRPIIEVGYALVIQIGTSQASNLNAFALVQGSEPEDILREIVTHYLPTTEVTALKIKQGFVYVGLSEGGYKAFNQLSRTRNIRREDLLTSLVAERIPPQA